MFVNLQLVNLLVIFGFIRASNASCSAGTYSINNLSPCLPCPANTYSNDNANSCKPCPPFSYSTGNASNCMLCLSGSYYVGGVEQCKPCLAGTFSNIGSLTCQSCPTNTYSFIAASSCLSCFAGTYYVNNSTPCKPCLPGTFSNDNATNCEPCPAGMYSNSAAKICRVCPAGYYITDGASKCLQCPLNTYSTGGVSSCSTCSAGEYYIDKMTACKPCPAGTYSKSGDLSCTPCLVGSYSTGGASSCLACPPRSDSNDGSSSCFLCSAGTYYDQTVKACITCPANSFSYDDSLDCTFCSAGTRYVNATAPCVPCLAGTYSNNNAAYCSPCAEGTYSPDSASSCIPCAAGKYSGRGAMLCKSCPAGTYSSGGGSKCVACPPLTFSTGGTASCSTCQPGTFFVDIATMCANCPAGYYSNHNATYCMACPPGTYSESNSPLCRSCPQGSISSAGSSTCESCPVGSNPGRDGSSCYPCPIFWVSVSGFALFILGALTLGFFFRRRLKQFWAGGRGVDGVKDVIMSSFLQVMWNRFDLYNQLHLVHLPTILKDSMSYVLAPFIVFTSYGAECAIKITWKFKDGFWLTFGVLIFVFSIGMFQLCKRPPRYGCTTRSFYAVINRNLFFSFSIRRGFQIMLRKAIAATLRMPDLVDGKRRLYGEASTIIDEYPHKQIYDLSVCIIIASHLALFLPFPSRYEVSEFPELYSKNPEKLWLRDITVNLNVSNKEYFEYWSFFLDIAGCYALAIRAGTKDEVYSIWWLLFLDLIRCYFTLLGAEMIVNESHIKETDEFKLRFFSYFLNLNHWSFAIMNICVFSLWFVTLDIFAITCSSTDFCLPGFSWILIFYFVVVSIIFISLSLPVIVKAFNKAIGPESELVDLADPDSLEDFPILKSFRLAISKSISRLSKRNSKTSTNLTKGINSGNSTIIDPVINPVVIISNPISSTRNLASSLSSTSSTSTSTNLQPHVTPDIEDRLVARKREILLAFANSKAKSRDEESSKNKAKTHTALTSTNSTRDLTLINSPDKSTKVRTLDTDADVSDANTFSTNSSATNTTNTAVNITTREQDFKEVKSSSVDDSTIIVHAKDTDVLVHKFDNDSFTKNVDKIVVNETDLLKSSNHSENHSENVFKVLDNKDIYENLLSHRMYMDTNSDITEAVSILRDYESNKFIKKDFYGRLLLHRACMTTSVNIDEVKHILQEYPQAIQEKDQDGRLPLHLACLNECPEKNSLVRLLLDRYADGAKCVDIDGRLPLHLHLSSMNSSEKLTVVQLLLDKYPLGSQSMDSNCSLPLHLACEYKADLDVVEFLLLKYEEGVKVQDKNGRLPLHLTHMSSSVVLSYKVRNKWRNAIDVKDIFGKIPADYDKTKIEIEHQFLAISQRLKSRGHHIRDNFLLQASQLGRLCKFVLICDDSSSMNKFVCPGPGAPPVDPLSADKPTRWTELRSTCEVVVELACAISESIDVHFLNHIGALKGIHTTEQFIAGFPAKPHGSVPLARAIRDVIAANKKLSKGKMLVILFATDGETDGGELEIAEVKEALATKPSWCKVQVLKITDNDDETSYLDEFDRAIEGVDVTDDYFSVLANVRKYRGQNTSFSFGDYLVKCLIGPLDKEIDEIDEPSRTT
jgi:hypothetical protein